MESYKSEFIEFMVESDVLKFGDFTLKSGRKSPFFMNAGAYVTGSQLKKLGEYYAKAIHASYGDDFDVLFGPAYKGIPLAVVTAIAFSELYGKEIRYCSDRKEAKDHGADKGGFLGSSLKDKDRVVMIEDVTTSGKSMEETVPKVRGAANVEIVGLMVSLNRMEVGQGGVKSALDEIHEKYGFEGNVVGVSKASTDTSSKFIGISDLKAQIETMINEHGIMYCGITGQNVTEELAAKYGLPSGVYISNVDIDSPAYYAGLQAGDVISAINGQSILTIQQFSEKLYQCADGEAMYVTAMRQGKDGYSDVAFSVSVQLKQLN